MKPTPTEQLAAPSARRNHNRNQHRVRRLFPYLGALALLGLILAGLWPRPVLVETTRVTVGPFRSTINEEGKTRVKQRYLISAPVAGRLRRIPFKAGAEVRAGETVLAVIDPLSPGLLDARSRSLAEARREATAAQLDKARAGHEFAASELRRIERLWTDKTVTIQELESAQWREAAAARDLAAAASALRQAEAELAEFDPAGEAGADSPRRPVEVKAPANGRVLRVFEESARVVTASTPLLEMGDPAELEVVIEVLSRDGGAIVPGAKVELDQWGGSDPLPAQVRLVEPHAFTKVSALGVEEQRVNVIADILAPPSQRPGLGDGFRVEARIVTWETEQTLQVPVGALFRRGQEWAAYLLRDGRARLQAVKVGRSGSAHMQVLEGLKPGDDVILYPSDRVKDGLRVAPIKI
jgi:HlyD family secretion protein